MTYLDRVQEFSNQTGLSVEEIIAEALEDWMATVGAALVRTAPDNVVEFPLRREAEAIGRFSE